MNIQPNEKFGLWLIESILPMVMCLILSAALTGCGGGAAGSPPIQKTQAIAIGGPGDMDNIFPAAAGDVWGYHVTAFETGQGALDVVETIRVTGTKPVSGYDASVFAYSSTDGTQSEDYLLKTGAGVYYLGNSADGSSEPFPYALIQYPLTQGSTFSQLNRSGIDYGTDLDGDGRSESLSIASTVTVAGTESVTVESGTFANCIRIVTSTTQTVTGSRDGRQVTETGTISEWYAPGMGLVKRHMELGAPGWSRVVDYSLVSFMVAGRKSDSTPPTIVSVQPSANSIQGALSSVSAVFSEDIDPATLNSSSFVVKDENSIAVPGTVTYANKTATFATGVRLNGTYTATIATAIQDGMANSLAADYSWTFTVDRAAPYVVATSPANNATNVPTSASVGITLSEPLSGYTVDYNSFTLKDASGAGITGRVSLAGNVVTLTPDHGLVWNTTYTATLTTAVTDAYGNSLATNYVWSFSTPLGDFLSPIGIPIGSTFPEAVAIGDVNGDGKNDVVVVTSFYNDPSRDGKVLVYLQNAAGGLDPPRIYPTSGSYANPPRSVAIGDVNNDGRNDVVVGISGKGIEVLLQDGSGALQPGKLYPGSDSHKIRIADLDGDGLAEVVGTGDGNGSVSVWHQSGATLSQPVSYAVANGTWDDLELGDVNNDGLIDIIVMSGKPNALYVLTQKQDGTFSPPAGGLTGALSSTGGIGVGDINGDGHNEVVMAYTANTPNGKIFVFSPDSQGNVGIGTSYASYDCPLAVAVADINGDGRKDIVVTHNGWSTIGVYLQQSDGSLRAEDRYRAFADNFNPHSLAVGDINGDGLADVVALDNNGGLTILYHRPAPAPAKAAAKATRNGADLSNIKGLNAKRSWWKRI